MSKAAEKRRNRSFAETHQKLIETAVRLISQKGVEAVSIAAVARATGLNRTAIYYHFATRDDLIKAVKLWSSEQLAAAFEPTSPQPERIDHITRFVLENPALIKLWIEGFLAPGDIRDRYPHWDGLIKGIRARFASNPAMAGVDAEVYCVNLLTCAFIAPRVFKNSISPEESIDSVLQRFRREWLRHLEQDDLIHPDAAKQLRAAGRTAAGRARRHKAAAR